MHREQRVRVCSGVVHSAHAVARQQPAISETQQIQQPFDSPQTAPIWPQNGCAAHTRGLIPSPAHCHPSAVMENLRLGRRRSKIEPNEYSVDYDGNGESSDNEYDDMEEGSAFEKNSNSDTDLDSVHRTNTAIGVLGVSYLRLRRIDQSWEEKVWMFVDSLQLFALLWSLSQPWPWPRPWLVRSRWVVYVNLDVVSIVDAAMTVTGPGTTSSPWGERPGYMWYGSVFSMVPVAIIGVWFSRLFLTQIWLNRGALFRRYVLGRGGAQVPASAVFSALAAFERFVLR